MNAYSESSRDAPATVNRPRLRSAPIGSRQNKTTRALTGVRAELAELAELEVADVR